MKDLIFLLCSLFSVLISQASSPALPVMSNRASLAFIENNGQITDQFYQPRQDIQYSIKATAGLNIFIASGAIHYQFSKAINPGHNPKLKAQDSKPESFDMYRMDVELVGANPKAKVVTEEKQVYHENYFNENTNGESITAYTYTRITYREIYPHIDWVLYIKDGKLEHEFIVHEGGRVSDIQLKYGGVSDLSINHKDGSLVALTPQGNITEQAPLSYSNNGSRIKSRFHVNGHILSYEADTHTGTMIIDPAISWGTYYGGSGGGYYPYGGVATDVSGNVYITGSTSSHTGIATSGSYQTTNNASNGTSFLAKFTTSGSIVWATYYGGTVGENGYGVTTDPSGNVYITGNTSSYSGIATNGAYQTSNNTSGGNYTGFLAKFNSSGGIIWGTYYGGNAIDAASAVATDPNGNVYITGYTESTTGIATSGAYQATNNTGTVGGQSDFTGFLAKFKPGGAIDWGTYFGGNVYDKSHGVAADAFGNVYITGETESTTGIATTDGYQTNDSAGGTYTSIFLANFNSSGADVWSTYYGGFGPGLGYGTAVDNVGGVYISGFTQSTEGIVTPGAYQTTGDGAGENFLVKFFTKLHHCVPDSMTQNISISLGQSLIVGTDTLSASGNYTDTIIGASISGCDSIVITHLTVLTGILGISAYHFSLSPNPTNGSLTITNNYPGTLLVNIINLLGERLKTYSMTGTQQSFDISDLAAGIYEVQISDGNQTLQVMKVVKE